MKSSPYLAYQIIDRMVDSIFSILEDVQGSLDDLEAVVFEEKKSFSTPINQARRQIARLRRIVVPLRLYVPDLSKAQKFSDENLAIYFSDVNHKISNISGTVDEMKEMVEIYKDTDFVTSSNRTNDVLSLLTILFTLTIPATLLSSIYGMNIPLPGGLDTGPLEFAGPYSSFLVIVILMLIRPRSWSGTSGAPDDSYIRSRPDLMDRSPSVPDDPTCSSLPGSARRASGSTA